MENSNDIQIQQAYFGEVSRSHGCLFATLNDDKLNAYLTAFSDKPYPIPMGITLNTYFASTVFSDWFIFTKTIPDSAASRAGMVFTHALIIKLADVEKINDLKLLFSYFKDAIPNKSLTLNPILYTSGGQTHLPIRESYPTYIPNTVGQMIKGKKVAFFGELDNFTDTLFVIWNGLPAQLRKSMTFNVGFSLGDIENKKDPILYFQKRLSAKIAFSGSINDDSSEEIVVTDSVEKLILGDGQLNDFEHFLNNLNCKLTDFNQLNVAEKAYRLHRQLETLAPDELRQLLRLIAKISPQAQSGIDIKNTVLEKLCSLIDQGKDYNIKALRNLDLDGFPNAEASLSSCTSSFVSNQFLRIIPFDTVAINGLLELTAESEGSDWWTKSIKKGLDHSIADPKSIESIWELLKSATTKLAALFALFKSDPKLEHKLTASIPQHLDTSVILNLKPFVKEKKWNTLYATVSLSHLQPQAALKEQLEVEKDLTLKQSFGTLLIAPKISDEKLLELSLANPDARLLELITPRIIKQPLLMKSLDVSDGRWIEIWNATLQQSKKLEFGVTDIAAKAEQLYDLILQKTFLPDQLMTLFSQSAYSDVTDYANRTEFWKAVLLPYRPFFLQATALGMSEKIATKSSFAERIEPELLSVMSSDGFVTTYLSKYRADLNAGINYFEIIPNLKDQFFADYINYYVGSIAEITSARLGNMVSSRNYAKTAEAIFQKSKGNSSFKIALNKVQGILHLNIFDKLLHGHLFGDNITDDTAYTALFETVKNLYKKGPEDEEIWERAGGDTSKLVNQNSREENWRRAIHLLRYGGGGRNISVKKLIKEINDEFPGNSIVKELQNYFKN